MADPTDAPAAADPAAAPPASPPAGTPPAVPPAGDPPADPAAKPAAAPAAKPGDAAAGAPDAYEFKTPDGAHEFDQTVIGKFGDAAKALNLTQAQAQSILDAVGPAMQARQLELHNAAVKTFYEPIGGPPDTWEAQAKADKEIGGDKLAENLALAKKFSDIGGPEFVKVLDAFGLGNHPAVLKAFVRYGKAVSEDSFVAPSGAKPANRSQADRIYGANS